MSKLYHDSDPLSLELMRKYREGTLSAEEKARLNVLQAQDPFIADALEGMAVVEDGNAFAEDVDKLRSHLKKRTRAKKSISVYLLPVAASLVLLIGAFYVVYHFVMPSDINQVTSKEAVPSAAEAEENPSTASELSPISLLPPEELTDSTALRQNELPQTLALVQLPSRETKLPAGTSQERAPELPAENYTQQDDIPQVLSEVEIETFDEKFSLSKKDEGQTLSSASYSARAKAGVSPVAPLEGGRTISGQVVDQESNDPIPGANVLVKGTKIGTITDMEGNFSLSLSGQHKQLLFSSIGYELSEINIDQEDTILVTLDQDIQMLSEVVVVGYGVQKRSAVTGSVSSVGEDADQGISTTSAVPQVGMRSFRQYLSDNQRYPEHWQEGDKAVVKLSFFVEPNGGLSNFTIEKSAGTWLDEEAIRLIQEGPAWETATRNGQSISQEVKVRVRFKK